MKKIKILLFLSFSIMISGIFATEKLHPSLSVGLSAVIPGAGCYYADKKKRASFYIVSDLMIWFSFFRLDTEAKRMKESNIDFAHNYSNAALKQNKNYYNAVSVYKSSEELNLEIEMYARNKYVIYENNPEKYEEYLKKNLVPNNLAWNWRTNELRVKYKVKRRQTRNVETYKKLAFSALFINRIISAIDSARIVRKINSENRSFSVIPDFKKNGLMVNYEVRF